MTIAFAYSLTCFSNIISCNCDNLFACILFNPAEESEPIILVVERQIIKILMLECLKFGLLWKNA